jgi:hypothetical protein
MSAPEAPEPDFLIMDIIAEALPEPSGPLRPHWVLVDEFI